MDMDLDHFMDYDCVYMDLDQTRIVVRTMFIVILIFLCGFYGQEYILCSIFACFSRSFFKQFYWI